ncbi:hypothetical protein N665_0932s0027 [Sinapis alba]|nr:hypothetical protein N665_0932s0027 [Sinapis alba]
MMKTSDAMTMITILLVVAITAASGEKEVVLDSEGNPVKAHAGYLIRHSNPDGGKASITHYSVRHHRFRGELRHLELYEEPVLLSAEESHGFEPVKFSLSSDVRSRKVVHVSTELHITFRFPSRYFSGVWRVTNYSSPIKTVVLSRLPEQYGTTFTIQKVKGGYWFAFGSADKPVTICADVLGRSSIAILNLSNSPPHPSAQVNTSCFLPMNFVPANLIN